MNLDTLTFVDITGCKTVVSVSLIVGRLTHFSLNLDPGVCVSDSADPGRHKEPHRLHLPVRGYMRPAVRLHGRSRSKGQGEGADDGGAPHPPPIRPGLYREVRMWVLPGHDAAWLLSLLAVR